MEKSSLKNMISLKKKIENKKREKGNLLKKMKNIY